MADDDYTVHHLEYDLTTVMQHFIDGFQPEEGREVVPMTADWFVDTAKRRVIFRLHTRAKSA